MTWESTLAEALDAEAGLVSIADPQPEITRWPYRVVLEQGTERAELANLTGKALSREITGAATYTIVRGLAGSDTTAHESGAAIIRSIPQSLLGWGGGDHPTLAAHEALGLAADHDHPYAADDHTHAAGDHPDLATHETLGLVTDTDLTTHAATAHGTSAHAISGVMHSGTLDHSALGSVTANQHHNQAHALGGADHSGSLAQASVTNLVTDLSGKADSGHDHDAAYSATDHTHAGGDHPDLVAHDTLGLATQAELDAHTHTIVDGDIPASIARDAEVTAAVDAHAGLSDPHPGYLTTAEGNAAYEAAGAVTAHAGAANPHPTYATDADLTTHAATPHGGSSGEVYAVDDLYITTKDHADAAAVATHFGYGTWQRFGVGRFLLLTDGTAGTEAGAATHSHTFTQPDAHTGVIDHTHTATVTDPQHAHVQGVNSATTGGTSGYTPDTSTNTRVNSGYSTSNAATGISVANASPAGAVASLTHANGAVADGSTDPLSITAYAWLRTA